ncbi:hypothetical protein DFH09DRAFT_1360517 [Mycena vulgaris]|nr:hypothetical protein DFH09DRAFT_1360517 [Mycena vulgaris]
MPFHSPSLFLLVVLFFLEALDPVAWVEEHAANPPATKKRKSKSKAQKGGDREEDELADDAAAEDAEAKADEEKAASAGKRRKRTGSRAPAKAKPKPNRGKAAGSEDDGAADEGEEEGGERERASKKPKVAGGAASKLESGPEALKEYRPPHRESLLSPSFFSAAYIDSGRQFSKIGKVMRHIHRLEESNVPRDDEFKFRERANNGSASLQLARIHFTSPRRR